MLPVLRFQELSAKNFGACERCGERPAAVEPAAANTVAPREIPSGTYGAVRILDSGDITFVTTRNPEDLRAAAKLFNELADFHAGSTA